MKTQTKLNVISLFTLFVNFEINVNELIYRLKTYKPNFFVRFNGSPIIYTKNELITDLSLPFTHKNKDYIVELINIAVKNNKIQIL